VVATLFTGGDVTLGTIAGLLAVLGIAVRGVVLLITRLLYLQRREGMAAGPRLILQGVRDRLVPTVVSALGIIALVAPIVVMGGATGLEIVQPAAVALIGGVTTSAIVILLVLPAGYLRFAPTSDADSWADDLMKTDQSSEHPAARSGS
jgi:Cu/Ag efflux pump CusA